MVRFFSSPPFPRKKTVQEPLKTVKKAVGRFPVGAGRGLRNFSAHFSSGVQMWSLQGSVAAKLGTVWKLESGAFFFFHMGFPYEIARPG